MPTITRKILLWWLSALFGIASCVGMLLWGETPWNEVWPGVVDRLTGTSQAWNPLLDERLPRLLVILCTGASLAVSGAVMQALFHNPLASPMLMGLTSGGSLSVVVVFVMGWHQSHPFVISLAAFAGCLATLLVVYNLSKQNGIPNMNNLLLSGIAVSTVLIALQGAIMYACRDRWELVQTFTEWEAGSSTDRSWQHVHLQLPLTIVGLLGCWFYRTELNLLALGEEEATNLGVEVNTVRWRLFLCISLLTGGALAAMGIIAFLGLVLPHLLRKLHGPDNRTLIALCTFVGGPILVSLDLGLRVFGLHELSIGSVSALLGGVFFLVLLFGYQRKQSLATLHYAK